MKTHALYLEPETKALSALLLSARWDEAAALVAKLPAEDLYVLLEVEARGAIGMDAYRFASYLADRTNDASRHHIAAKLALEVFGSYSEIQRDGMDHLLKAVEEAPEDWKLKELALHFTGEGVLPNQYVKYFAEAVLKVEPANRIALSITENYRNFLLS
jgi:hypothetical protein